MVGIVVLDYEIFDVFFFIGYVMIFYGVDVGVVFFRSNFVVCIIVLDVKFIKFYLLFCISDESVEYLFYNLFVCRL